VASRQADSSDEDHHPCKAHRETRKCSLLHRVGEAVQDMSRPHCIIWIDFLDFSEMA
jgi:hypothetical protein